MFYMKVHSYDGRITLAVCDEELLGSRLKGEKVSVLVSNSFYGGDLVDDKVVIDMVKGASSANFIGNECVGILIEQGIIEKGKEMNIGGQKHVQIYDLSNVIGRA